MPVLKLLALAVAGALFQRRSVLPLLAQAGRRKACRNSSSTTWSMRSPSRSLKRSEAEAPAPTPPPASRSPFDAANQDQPDEITLFFGQAATTLKAVPVGHYLGEFRRALDQSAQGGMGRRVFLLLLAAVVAVALAIEAVLRWLLGGLRLIGLAKGAVPERGLRSLAQLGILALLDGLGVATVWLVGRASVALWFGGTSIQDRFAGGFLFAIVLWRLAAPAAYVVRPTLADARLCEMEDMPARRLFRLASAFLLLAIMGRLLYYVELGMGATPDAIAPGGSSRTGAVGRRSGWSWARGRARGNGWATRPGDAGRRFIGRNWVAVAVPFFVAMIATQLYGAVSGRTGVPSAMILTLNLVAGLLVFETLLQALVRQLDSQCRDSRRPASGRSFPTSLRAASG